MQLLDTIIFIVYGAIIVIIGNLVAKNKGGNKGTDDYFFANKTLPWYLVGTSIIAANISSEQFIGMSGSGYATGIAIAIYDWLAALMLIVVAKFFLPIFVKKEIYTMPQFLELRYDKSIKTILAVFWLCLFVFVNLSSILYLGALSLQAIFDIPIFWGIVGLAIFSLLYTIVNGLKAIASTDIIQVFFLVVGGLITTFIAVNKAGGDEGIFQGFANIYEQIPDKFHMIIKKGDPNFKFLPGIRAAFGGIWIAGIYYFGANQYIIQKAFGAKSLREAQKGMAFAGYIKLIMPIVTVVPGIAAFAMGADIVKPDEAYPWLLQNIVPSGIKGLIFAALIAAIVSSFSAIINSASTIFTMDLYHPYIKKDASEKHLVSVGRLSSVVVVVLAVVVACFLGNLEQAFQFIQEYTGMVSPGITAIFVLGLYWKRTSSRAALAGTILSIPISIAIKTLFGNMPFLDQMVVSFIVVLVIIIAISLLDKKAEAKGIDFDKSLFHTSKTFNIMSLIIVFIITAIYALMW